MPSNYKLQHVVNGVCLSCDHAVSLSHEPALRSLALKVKLTNSDSSFFSITPSKFIPLSTNMQLIAVREK